MASQKDSSAVGCTKRKHNTISIQDKVEVLEKLDRGVSVRQLCETYGIGKTTVVDIKKQREKILAFYTNSDSKKQMSTRKTMKDSKSTEHDRVMIEWFRRQKSEGVDLSGRMMKFQAKLFHEQLKLEHKCDYSDGWLNRFKKRHGISLQKCGEKRSANHQDVSHEFAEEFSKYATDENLSLEVYNTDENSMYWRCTTRKSLITDGIDVPSGFKQDSSDENLTDWEQVHKETPIMSHHRGDAENMSNVVVNEIKNNESDDDDDNYIDVSVGFNIDRLIELMTDLIEGLGQQSFVTEQELMNFHLMYEKLHKERSKYMMKQLRLGDMVKKGTMKINSASCENPMTSSKYGDDLNQKMLHPVLKSDS